MYEVYQSCNGGTLPPVSPGQSSAVCCPNPRFSSWSYRRFGPSLAAISIVHGRPEGDRGGPGAGPHQVGVVAALTMARMPPVFVSRTTTVPLAARVTFNRALSTLVTSNCSGWSSVSTSPSPW